MRHRGAASHTGLGNPSPELLDGKKTGDEERDKLINECAKEMYEQFLEGTALDYQRCDAQADKESVHLGIEPSYMYESLKIIIIRAEKHLSQIVTGYAWGPWGSGVRQTSRLYEEYTRKSKFVLFIDKWHPLLFPEHKGRNQKLI